MERPIYSNLGQKKNKTFLRNGSFAEILSLKDLVRGGLDDFDQDALIKAFCNDLKQALNRETIFQMIQDIFTIESYLHSLQEGCEKNIEFPVLEEFYRGLSPVLLRSLWEGSKSNLNNHEVIRQWKEALRIALEEEFYIWQEKIDQ